MLECPNCRRTFPSGTRFCGTCGTALSDTLPAAVSQHRGYAERPANGQDVSGFQAKERLEDTIVRKKPEGFSWQVQPANLRDDESPQASGLVYAPAEELTISLTKASFPHSSPETPLSTAQNVLAASSFSIPHSLVHPPYTPAVASPLVVTRSSEANEAVFASDKPGKATNEQMPFTIPIRPGRARTHAPASEQATEISDDTTASSSPRPLQIVEKTASHSRHNMPGYVQEVLIDYEACAEVISAAEINSLQIPASKETSEAVQSTASTLGETFISDEFLAKITKEADAALFATTPETTRQTHPIEENTLDPTTCFAAFLKPDEVPVHQRKQGEPYLHLKQELAAQRMEITAAMDELLPLVYDNHRVENEALFAYILTHRPALDDEAWGHATFVLGAYGNYMYRHPLSFTKKLEIWRAQLWAVYYERSYRRKYLAQRCQQLIHFFQGCAENATFLSIALHDLETLYVYLEPGSLRKLQTTLQALPLPPAELLQCIEAHMGVAEQEKAERMARQLAPTQPKTQPSPPLNARRQDRPATWNTSNKGSAYVPVHIPPGERNALTTHGNPDKGTTLPPKAETQGEAEFALFVSGQKWLDFLSKEQQHLFFESLRADRLEMISQLLQPARQHILSALRTELLHVSPVAYQRPRKSVPVRQGTDHDRFIEAFRLLNSPKLKDQQTALRLFEENAQEHSRQEQQPGAHEWMLYARALVQGSTRVAPDWERAFKHEEASWEEIWNLAYYHYVVHDLLEVMHILTPGLHILDAPVSHLCLALICALTVVLDEQGEKQAVSQARNLLLQHLERWPHPLSCLAWLTLNYEGPNTLRPLDLSKRLSVFQALLEYPLELPDPRRDLTEAQFHTLHNALTNKTHCEEAWFLWLNDYAARRPRNELAWQSLADTSERMERMERAETALQHIAGMYYDFDYVYAQEGEEQLQAANELRAHVEKLFAFYQRHKMQRQAWDSFESCYATLQPLGLWDERKSTNSHLLTLVQPFLVEYQRRNKQTQQAQHLSEAQDARTRSEIRRNELSNNPTRPLEHFQSGKRVGIFVDYENIARLIPMNQEMEAVWQTLASYAAQFGEVVCRWASASPRNLTNLTDVRAGMEAAQFKIRYPRRELQFSASQKDLADYALLECINTASLNDRLDIYLIVSGDRDYYERIYSLLEAGRSVRILASACNLSTSYRELAQQRQRKHDQAGHAEADFFIDELEEVFHSLPTSTY